MSPGALAASAAPPATPATRVVLVVDDEPHIARLVQALVGPAWRVEAAAGPTEALARLDETPFDVVLSDLAMPDGGGIELVRRARARDRDTPFVMYTAQASVESAVAAMREGAFDYLRKTAAGDELRAALDRAADHGRLAREVRRLRREVERASGVDEIIGQSPPMRRLLELVERVAAADTSVLILGESGTGKELLARAIHRRSTRRDAPFVAFDCSALAPSLLESELFGHEKGAFTGAQRARRGLFREAQGGTLLLDEIGDVAPEVQNKLLRVLQQREIKPVGADAVVKVDVRILAATNKDLKALVAHGAFREDLYYRLAVMPLVVPPLRERREDLPLLAAHILAKRRGDRALRLSASALGRLAAYHWPGNIRELENVLQRAAILAPGDEITPAELPLGDAGSRVLADPPLGNGTGAGAAPGAVEGAPGAPDVALGGRTLKEIVDDATRAVERAAIGDALVRAEGSPTKAAKLLGISRASIYNKMKELGIQP